MKNSLLLIILTLCSIGSQAQITDVYQNRNYEIITRSFDQNIAKEYTPTTFEINQDKNRNGNENWANVEAQLVNIAVGSIKNEVAFFTIQSRIENNIEQANKRIRLERKSQYGASGYSTNFDFRDVDIVLYSVVNGFGTYAIQYNFEVLADGDYAQVEREFTTTRYFLAEYDKRVITEIGKPPTASQQGVLKKLTQAELRNLYLVQTQKLNLSDVERVRNAGKEPAIGLDFSTKVDFAEAVVYPYFSGLMVAFPQFSSSAQMFNNKSFRVLIKHDKVAELSSVFPKFKMVFNHALIQPSLDLAIKLNDADNFDLTPFKSPPIKREVLEFLDFDKKIYTMEVQYYDWQDTLKKPRGSQTYYFDENQLLSRTEQIDEMGNIWVAKNYTYTPNGQLISLQTTASESTLKLYFYRDSVLNYTETIDLNRDRTYSGHSVEIQISQEHFAYNANARYSIKIDLVGELNPNDYQNTTALRLAEPHQYRTNLLSFILGKNQRVIGVKHHRFSLIDVLTNEKGLPLESYFDRDRYTYFFTYNDEGKIVKYEAYADGEIVRTVDYQYLDDASFPLLIRDTKSPEIQEYHFAFW